VGAWGQGGEGAKGTNVLMKKEIKLAITSFGNENIFFDNFLFFFFLKYM
jgi:hypothetical protein